MVTLAIKDNNIFENAKGGEMLRLAYQLKRKKKYGSKFNIAYRWNFMLGYRFYLGVSSQANYC